MPDLDLPGPALARAIVARVGEVGQPPEVGIEYLNVGNESILGVLEREYIAPIAQTGRGSSFKLVQAYFGGGKTHFLTCVRRIGWRHGLASAMVGLSPDECPFDDPLRIYQAIARELSWPPADPTVPPTRGIEHTLRTAFGERRDTLGPEGFTTWLDGLMRLPVDAPSFRSAALAFGRAWAADDFTTEDLLAS